MLILYEASSSITSFVARSSYEIGCTIDLAIGTPDTGNVQWHSA